MKKFLLLTALLIASRFSQAQNGCDGIRYRTAIFSEVKVTEAIQYGSAVQLLDLAGPGYTPVLMNQKLYVDVYEPVGDDRTERPLIIFAFGGAFIAGTRADVKDLCMLYAKMGYVTASIDYRLSRELVTAGLKLDPAVAPKAVLKGAHDMKASVRYFNSTIQNGNRFNISSEKIFVGGISAGAFCALHTAYLDKESEMPAELAEYAAENGGIEGNSGNPGFSSKVAGVINFSGALGQATWLEAGDVPVVSTHGTNDGVVPYGSDSVTILAINYPVDGSSVIHERANEVGVKNAFYTYYGAGHAQESASAAYLDSGFTFSRDFMYELMCEKDITFGVAENGVTGFSAYPNPASAVLNLGGLHNGERVELYSSTAQLVYTEKATSDQHHIQLTDLPKGLYSIRISGANRSLSRNVIVD
ncbi:MAG: T9SS type A sorting domain-containing protein [Bacteroidota bacterium]